MWDYNNKRKATYTGIKPFDVVALSKRAFILAQPFNLAWWWSNAMQDAFYVVWFDCEDPYTDCGNRTVFLNVAYAAALTALSIIVVILALFMSCFDVRSDGGVGAYP